LPWTDEAQNRIDDADEKCGGRVSWRHIGAEELLALLQAGRPINDELKLAGEAMVETFDFRRVLIGRLPVAELARLTETHGDQLFEKNVRRCLSAADGRVDDAIAATLKDPNQRANFYFHSDGITVTCSQFRHDALRQHNWTVRVNDLRIVGGRQIARTVQRLRKAGDNLEGADALIRIHELNRDDTEIVDAITFATNGRDPVDVRDMKANDHRQKALKESIAGLGYEYRAKREDRTVSSNEFTSAVIAEAVLAVWRKRPHQAGFGARQHFGSLYDTIFTRELNGAQAVVAALLLRRVESRRKRPPEDAPDFLPYGSRFVAMLMGDLLLEEMSISLDQLDHRNFKQALDLVEEMSGGHLKRAENRIGEELDRLFREREPTLQRLSAIFRRADLVDMLSDTVGDSAP